MSDPKTTHIDLTKVIKCDIKTVRLFFEACEELLEYYRGNSLPWTKCYLCVICLQSRNYQENDSSTEYYLYIRCQHAMGYCLYCPWIWFTKKTCVQYQIDNFPGECPIGTMHDRRMEPWTSHRIEQLDKTWIPNIEHYLKLKGNQKT